MSSVITSVLTYGIAIWADALQLQDARRKVASVYRLSALRVASAFRTVSEDAVCVIAGMLPPEILAKERRSLYRLKGTTIETPEEQRVEERRKGIDQWQMLWDASTKGRWTHRLIPQVDVWLNRKHGEVNYYLTQLLSGHGCFRAYLYRFKHDDSPECPTCKGVNEDAEHAFFVCPRFSGPRSAWETALEGPKLPEEVVSAMLVSEAAWEATSSYAAEVIKELRRVEQKRRKEKSG